MRARLQGGTVSARKAVDIAIHVAHGLGAAYDEMIRKLTPQQIQAAAKQYFNTSNYARFVLLPEK